MSGLKVIRHVERKRNIHFTDAMYEGNHAMDFETAV